VNQFYAAFIPGLQNVIARVIKERLKDAVIHKLLDGAVIFETETSYDKLNFFCFNNIFAIVNVREENHAKTQRREGRREDVLLKNIRCFIEENKNYDIISNNSKNFKTFRIVISNENQPAAIDEKLRVEAEKYISRISGLKVNRSLPDTEFWFLYRRDDDTKNNFTIFMKRLTLRPSWEKTLHKGELPPPLTWVLCRLADIKHNDTVLDPFCGYGSIPNTAMKYFHITNFFASDNNKEAASYTASRFKKKDTGNFIIHKADFEKLPAIIKEKSIDVIITDPPWGHFKEVDNTVFLKQIFEIFGKLLKDGGRAVVLYANDDNFLKAQPSCFELQESIPILLSGKKAIIYILEKSSHGGTETRRC